MLKAILFDLDGTLLPMDQEVFAKTYFKKITAHSCKLGYTPEQFMTGMKAGISAMIRNDGSRTGEEVFWDAFGTVCGRMAEENKAHVDAFYGSEFDSIRSVCGYDPRAAEVVRYAKARGLRVILATNPIFPAAATYKRVNWAGLDPDEFELCTTYENFGLCKPKPAYYTEILRRAELTPDECLMVGNDVTEDAVAGGAAGLRVFLIPDCLISPPDADLSAYPHGSFDDLKAYIDTLLA